MRFLFATYSGVALWQLLVPWIIAGVLFGLFLWAIAKALSLRRKVKHMEWVKASQWSHDDYFAMLQRQKETIRDLESRLNRAISRPRDKSGRFQGKEK